MFTPPHTAVGGHKTRPCKAVGFTLESRRDYGVEATRFKRKAIAIQA